MNGKLHYFPQFARTLYANCTISTMDEKREQSEVWTPTPWTPSVQSLVNRVVDVLNGHVNSVKTPRVSHPCHKFGHRLAIINIIKVWVLLHLGWNRDFWEWTIAKYPLLMTACGQWSTVIFVLIYFDPTMHHFIILNDHWFI